jgi:hypothetical protein
MMLIDGAMRSLVAATALVGGFGALAPAGAAGGGADAAAEDGDLVAITVTVTTDGAEGDSAVGSDPRDVLAELARCVAEQGVEVPLPPTGDGDGDGDVTIGRPLDLGEVVAEIGAIGDGRGGPVVVSRRDAPALVVGGVGLGDLHDEGDADRVGADELPHAGAAGTLVVGADLAAELTEAADACVPTIEAETGAEVTIEVGEPDDGELVVEGVPGLPGVPADEIGARFEALGECMADAGFDLPEPHIERAVDDIDGGGIIVRGEHDAEPSFGPGDEAFVEAFEACHAEVGLPLPGPGAGIVISHRDGDGPAA